MSLRLPATWIGFLLGAGAWLLQFSLTLGKRWLETGDSLPGTLLFFFTFYTILTNLMLILIYLSDLVHWRWLGWWRSPVTRAMMAGAITLVGVFNHLLLAGLQQLTGLDALADLVLHYVAPAWFVLWWVIFQPRGTLRLADIPLMLLPTLVWLIWAMARGTIVNEYPYPILNATKLGYPAVALNCLLVFLGLLLIYLLTLALDRLLPRRPTT